MEVLKNAIQNPTMGPDMHLTLFRLYWSPDQAHNTHSASTLTGNLSDDLPSSPTLHSSSSSDAALPHGGERLYGEVYVGDAMNREHEEIRANLLKTHVEPYPETVVAAILLYSDSTHLAQFGKALLWLAYA